MTTNPTELATKIAIYIAKNAPVSYEQLRLRAESHKIPMGVFSNAMVIIHRSKRIEQKSKGDDIIYTIVIPKAPPSAGSHITWVKENYPPMTKENDGSGIDVDFSYLFLKPDEMKEYKAAAKGMPVHMMRDYERN